MRTFESCGSVRAGDEAEAEARFQRAIDVARGQNSRTLELRLRIKNKNRNFDTPGMNTVRQKGGGNVKEASLWGESLSSRVSAGGGRCRREPGRGSGRTGIAATTRVWCESGG